MGAFMYRGQNDLKVKGLRFINPYAERSNTMGLPFNSHRRSSSLNLKGYHGFRAVLRAGNDNDVSFPSDGSSVGHSTNDELGRLTTNASLQTESVVLGTIAADMAPASDGFFPDDDERDLDLPTAGFSSIQEAIEDIRQGKVGSHNWLTLFLFLSRTGLSLTLVNLSVCDCCR